MSRRSITGFVDDRAWEWRELRDPDGPPTWRQVRALFRAGALKLVEPGAAEPITKAEAAAAIDAAFAAGLLERREQPDPGERYDRTCKAIVEYVRAHPGCSTTDVVDAVTAAKAYTGERVRDLLDLHVLVDRSPRKRVRELYDAEEDRRERQ
jgi:hypothetical protein